MKNLIIYSLLLVLLLYLVFRPDQDYNPSQEEIQSESYVDKTKNIQDYPYPQLSRTFKRLSQGKSPVPLNNDDKILPTGTKDLNLVRTSDHENVKTRMYLPDYYRKDRLSGNPTMTEELRPFGKDSDKSESSWTDKNVSEHPKFYNADIKDELTNIGSFFDKNNYYVDKTSSNSETLPSDSCYKDRTGNTFCEDNTRLQLIPPKLISDPNSCLVLNSIGPYKDSSKIEDSKERVINGGEFYDNIKASLSKNESFSSFNNNPIELYQNY